MAHIPENVATSALMKVVMLFLNLFNQGKVRDTYELPDHPDLLLAVATDRISIFDFVLNALVQLKGAVLTAMTVFWLKTVLKDIPNHLVAYGAGINEYLPEELRNNRELQSRALVVRRLNMHVVELIDRGFLTGTGWESYQKDGTVCGIKLPPGLHDGSRLPEAIFTPTTKAATGHDKHMTFAQMVEMFGEKLATQLRDFSLEVYRRGREYAESRGVLIADTKTEAGFLPGSDEIILGDEVLTPDSSRFWLQSDWEAAVTQKKSPAGYDKQPVREWGKTVATPFRVKGLHKLEDNDQYEPPENPEYLAFVAELEVPTEVLEQTTDRYRKCFEMLVGTDLETYQRDEMGIAA